MGEATLDWTHVLPFHTSLGNRKTQESLYEREGFRWDEKCVGECKVLQCRLDARWRRTIGLGYSIWDPKRHVAWTMAPLRAQCGHPEGHGVLCRGSVHILPGTFGQDDQEEPTFVGRLLQEAQKAQSWDREHGRVWPVGFSNGSKGNRSLCWLQHSEARTWKALFFQHNTYGSCSRALLRKCPRSQALSLCQVLLSNPYGVCWIKEGIDKRIIQALHRTRI